MKGFRGIMKKIILSSLLSSVFTFAGGEITPIEPMAEKVIDTSVWEQSITVYGWLPSFDGTLNYTIPGSGGGDVEIDWLDKIDMFFMADYEIRKDKWSFLADIIYLDMSDSQASSLIGNLIPVTSQQDLTGWLISLYGGYSTLNTENVTLDIIAGLRYFSIDLDIDGTVGGTEMFSVSPSTELYDAVLGVKGKVDLSDTWYVPFHFDIGTGDSDLTWQASISIAYRFDWGDALLTYRYIHYDVGNTGLVHDIDMYGPKVGVVFHF